MDEKTPVIQARQSFPVWDKLVWVFSNPLSTIVLWFNISWHPHITPQVDGEEVST